MWSVTRRSDVRQGIRASKRNRFLWTTTNLVWLFRWFAMSRRRTTRPWSSPASALAIAAFSSLPSSFTRATLAAVSKKLSALAPGRLSRNSEHCMSACGWE